MNRIDEAIATYRHNDDYRFNAINSIMSFYNKRMRGEYIDINAYDVAIKIHEENRHGYSFDCYIKDTDGWYLAKAWTHVACVLRHFNPKVALTPITVKKVPHIEDMPISYSVFEIQHYCQMIYGWKYLLNAMYNIEIMARRLDIDLERTILFVLDYEEQQQLKF